MFQHGIKVKGEGSYPTYEEWKQDCNILDIYCFDSSYPTYEEWKQPKMLSCFVVYSFLSYLWGMETFYKKSIDIADYIVLILPMRNGNWRNSQLLEWKDWKGSYPTYEEWKQPSAHCKTSFTNNVLILPMRNGNNNEEKLVIEGELVLILPMRNGNIGG